MSEVEVRVSKKNTLYIPKSIAEALSIREGARLKMRVEGNKLVAEVIPDPFWLALKGSKFSSTTFEEFEEESEKMQEEIFGGEDTS
ncbi:MAG: AbrB/MazE/SpoVT family DNA-binding domain-containing protein [Candidatus Bathyarchaeia archaeon]